MGLEEFFLTGVSDASRRLQNKILSTSEYLLLRRISVAGVFTWGEFPSFNLRTEFDALH